MKKVLIITYYWPPSGGAGVQRWLKFVKYFPEHNIKPYVYTVEDGEYPSVDWSLQDDIPTEAEVIKRPIWEPYNLFKLFSGKKKSDHVPHGLVKEAGKEGLMQKISIWIRGNLMIPDPRMFWIRPSYKFLKKYILENGIDTIVSTGPPHSMHLIALKLKKDNPLLNWLADFRDPWTDIDFYKDLKIGRLADRRHHQLEKEVLTTADKVVTISPSLASDLSKISGKRVEVITNGYDASDYSLDEVQLDRCFSLTHAGSINSDRNQHLLWKALSALCQEEPDFKKELVLRFIGSVDYSVHQKLENFGLIENAEFIKHVPHDQVVKYQMSSRILMLFINKSPNLNGILPGKVFEYMATRRPILAIGPKSGDINHVFKSVGLPEVLEFEDILSMKNYISQLYQEYRNGDDSYVNAEIRKYSRRYLTSEMSKLLLEFDKE